MPRSFFSAAATPRIALLILAPLFLCTAALSAAPFVPGRDAQCVAISPDGRLSATGKSGMSNSEFPPRPHPSPNKCGVVEIWRTGTGERLHRVETFGDIVRLAFSPDGAMLVSARLFASDDGIQLHQVRVIDVESGKVLRDFNRCHSFAISPDGRQLAVLTQTKCILFDPSSWKKLREIEPLGGAISVDFSPRADSIVGVKRVEAQFALVLCNAADGAEIGRSRGLKQPFYHARFSPDGRRLATGHVSGLLLWDVAGAEADGIDPIDRFETRSGAIEYPFFSPDGLLLASGNQKTADVVLWEVPTSRQVKKFTFDRGTFHTYYRRRDEQVVRPETDPTRFAFTPDGAAFIAGCYGGIIRTISSGQEVRRLDP